MTQLTLTCSFSCNSRKGNYLLKATRQYILADHFSMPLKHDETDSLCQLSRQHLLLLSCKNSTQEIYFPLLVAVGIPIPQFVVVQIILEYKLEQANKLPNNLSAHLIEMTQLIY